MECIWHHSKPISKQLCGGSFGKVYAPITFRRVIAFVCWHCDWIGYCSIELTEDGTDAFDQ